MQLPSSLFDILLKQNFSGLASKDYLQQVASEHPYFTPAQFYLLQQTATTDSNYDEQAAKTALLFNNPYWLNFQLQQINKPVATVKEAPVISMYAENSDNNDDVMAIEKETLSVESMVVEEITVTEDTVTVVEKEDHLFEPAPVAENTDNDDDIVVIEKDSLSVEPTPVEENIVNDDAVVEKEILPFASTTVAENTDNNNDEAITEQEIAPIKIDMTASLNQSADDKTLSFEPMHLVDYFASQGIKLTEEVQTADKLGKQLKSFTEWLKTMKKIHVAASDTNTGQSDIAIQTLAEKSNAEGEIITEAMAEVFARQSKVGKAIELYQKLSLFNPLKSAYFAAKIEQLKGV